MLRNSHDESSYNRKHIRNYSDKVTYCIFIIPIGFRLFAIAEFPSIVNDRKNYSAKWDQGFTVKERLPIGHYPFNLMWLLPCFNNMNNHGLHA